MFAEPKLFDRQ